MLIKQIRKIYKIFFFNAFKNLIILNIFKKVNSLKSKKINIKFLMWKFYKKII